MNPALTTLKLVFCTGDRQLVQRFRRPDIAHHFEFSAGSVAEDSGKIGTALRHGLLGLKINIEVNHKKNTKEERNHVL